MAKKKKLPNQQTEGQSKTQLIREQAWSASFSGPMPHPALMEKYEQILPGAAERLFAMAENQQNHRHRLENLALKSGIKRSWGGLWMGFFIAVFFLIGAVFLGYHGHETSASVIGGSSVIGIVSTFIYGGYRQYLERKERVEKMTGHGSKKESL